MPVSGPHASAAHTQGGIHQQSNQEKDASEGYVPKSTDEARGTGRRHGPRGGVCPALPPLHHTLQYRHTTPQLPALAPDATANTHTSPSPSQRA